MKSHEASREALLAIAIGASRREMQNTISLTNPIIKVHNQKRKTKKR